MAETTPTKMGFEGVAYYGTAATKASTQLLTATDVSYSMTPNKAATTARGAGTSPPMTTERVVSITMQIEWTMINKIGGAGATALAACRVAAAAGTGIALRLKDYSADGGKGFDGDVTLDCKEGYPQGGEQTFAFTATPTNAYGREPVAYSSD